MLTLCDLGQVDMQRAARTDAGVHAAGNLVSLKMIVDPPIPATTESSPSLPLPPTESSPASITPKQLVAHINSFLPPEIRIWSFLRTRNTFNARMACDSRRYEYLVGNLPSAPKIAIHSAISVS